MTDDSRATRAPGRKRRWAKILVPLLAVSLVLNIWHWSREGRPEVGHWLSLDGRREYTAAYDEALAAMPEPAAVRDVPTSFGTVRAYLFTPDGMAADDLAEATPIVLLPGWGSGAPMWSENLPGLAAERPVWAFDALGDAGMSAQTVPLESDSDEAAWIDETLAGLGVASAHVVGHSFGGASAMNFALHHPGRTASLTLLEPVRTFADLPLKLILATIPSQLPFLPQSWRDASLAYIGGADAADVGADPVSRMIAAGTAHFSPERSIPAKPDDADLASLDGAEIPVFVHFAADSTVTDPETAAGNARNSLPEATVTVWPGTGHSLPMEKSADIDHSILDGLAAIDGR